MNINKPPRKWKIDDKCVVKMKGYIENKIGIIILCYKTAYDTYLLEAKIEGNLYQLHLNDVYNYSIGDSVYLCDDTFKIVGIEYHSDNMPVAILENKDGVISLQLNSVENLDTSERLKELNKVIIESKHRLYKLNVGQFIQFKLLDLYTYTGRVINDEGIPIDTVCVLITHRENIAIPNYVTFIQRTQIIKIVETPI
jgi:hypothetical protein